jgi:hypothetical protein
MRHPGACSASTARGWVEVKTHFEMSFSVIEDVTARRWPTKLGEILEDLAGIVPGRGL